METVSNREPDPHSTTPCPDRHTARRRPWRIIGGVAALLLIMLPALQLYSAETQQAQNVWRAAYWNNPDLFGEPVLTRTEFEINHDWGLGSPAPSIDADNFSARWTRTVTILAGTYRFTAFVDDGMRIWINDTPIFDEWDTASASSFQEDLFLSAGTYEIRVEYFEGTGAALAKFERTPVFIQANAPGMKATEVPPSDQWSGAYFNNMELSGVPTFLRSDNTIDFDWGTGSPEPGVINPDMFSVRWMRTLNLAGGRYRFSLTVDDGARLYVDDQLLIDKWFNQVATTYTAEYFWAGGPLPVRLDYYEDSEEASVRLVVAEIPRGHPSYLTPTPTPTPVDRVYWRAEYFDNVNLFGQPVLERTDEQIDFNWRLGSPDPDLLGYDQFSVRWAQSALFTTGCYLFTVTADDGVRLRLNGDLVIDAFIVQNAETYTYFAELPHGFVDITMEYFEETGFAQAHLTWERKVCPHSYTQPVPTPVPLPELPLGEQSTATLVGAHRLTVRAGPGVDFESVGTVTDGESVVLLGRNDTGNWTQIQLPSGITGWISSRAVSFE